MRKAVQLKVILYVEGEDEPAHDFAASTIADIKKMIESAAKRRKNLQVMVKSVEEDTSEE